MSKLIIQKGNLYNHLTQKIDHYLLDSNEYDLKIIVDNQTTFYRIRFYETQFEAIKLNNIEHFTLPKYGKPCSPLQITSFRTTKYYHQEFPYRKLLNSSLYQINKKYSCTDEYYCYLCEATGKNSISSTTLLDFVISATGKFKKTGVKDYQISIELAKNRYYVFFIKELAEKGFSQTSKILYNIYDRKDIEKYKSYIEDIVLELCLKYDYPIALTEFLFIITKQDLNLLQELMQLIMQAKEKQELNILLLNKLLKIIEPTLNYDNNLKQELMNYINSSKDDISYQLKKK